MVSFKSLNLMASWDISHKPFTKICEICKHYSRSRAKNGKNVRDPYSRNLKGVSSGGITKVEIGNLLENFKTDILITIGSQLDTLNIKNKKEVDNARMCIFSSGGITRVEIGNLLENFKIDILSTTSS